MGLDPSLRKKVQNRLTCLTHIAKLFGIHELTGKINKNTSSPMNNVEANICIKCMVPIARTNEQTRSLNRWDAWRKYIEDSGLGAMVTHI